MDDLDVALPEPQDEAEATVVRHIREFGWHVVLVRRGVHEHDEAGPSFADPVVQAAYDANFTYTVGLELTFRHPEVVLVGDWQHAHPYLNVIGDLIRDGRRFSPGDTSDELLDGFTVRFCPVGDAVLREALTWAHWAARRGPFRALQLVLPDTSGRWPGDPAYNGFDQPDLA